MAENLTIYLVIVLSINMFLFMGQLAIDDINPGKSFFSTGDNMALFSHQNYTFNRNASQGLPSGVNSVSEDTGATYTDDFSTSRSWLLENSGVGYILGMLSAPYTFLSVLGLPEAFTFLIGTFWYGITLYLIVAFVLGRQT